MSPLLLVDGHAYAYRAFHAIRSLNGPDGNPTNAIFGFVKMLGRMLAEQKPSHRAVVWDGGLDEKRMALLPEYKAQRPAMPDSLAEQIEAMVDYLAAARVTSIRQDGVEADDLIGVMARRAAAAGQRVVIASADKDFFQLVSDSVGLLNPNDKSGKVWGPGDVVAKTGVKPEQVVDLLSLLGDAVDNVPGVPGVGPKTAAALLNEFGSVNGIYARLEAVGSERIREALQSAEAAVRRNQEMIRLPEDLPGVPEMHELLAAPADQALLLELYRRWGFRGLAAEAEQALKGQAELFG